VFKAIAMETLRLLGVPYDVPETAAPEPATEEETIDVAIASLSRPPDDISAAPAMPAPEPAPETPQATTFMLAAGPVVPSFEGKTVRAVLEESFAAGVPVEVIGSGVARAQLPAAGSPLGPGERVRVYFK